MSAIFNMSNEITEMNKINFIPKTGSELGVVKWHLKRCD